MRLSVRRLTAVTVGVGILLGGAAVASAQKVLKYGHVYEPVHPMHKASVAAADHIKACTKGGIRVDVYPSSQLGKETALNEQVRFGGVDIFLTGQLFASGAYSPLAAGAAPYIFRDRDHALKYRTSDVLKELMAGWDKATGQHMLSAGYFGAFNFSSNKPVYKPEDMKGLKIRVPDAPLWMAFPRAVGANPTPVVFAEVYLALKQGLVEASVNPLPVTYAFKFYEVQKYVVLTGHLVEYAVFIVGDHVWKTLSPAERKCMQEGADLYADRSTREIVEQEDTLRAKMEREGLIKFIDPDREAFRKATAHVIDELTKQGLWPQAIVDRIRAIK